MSIGIHFSENTHSRYAYITGESYGNRTHEQRIKRAEECGVESSMIQDKKCLAEVSQTLFLIDGVWAGGVLKAP